MVLFCSSKVKYIAWLAFGLQWRHDGLLWGVIHGISTMNAMANVYTVAVLFNEYTFMILCISFPPPPQSFGLAHEVMDFIKYAPYCYKLLYQFLFHSRGYLYCIFITIVFVEGKEFYIKVYSKLVRPRKLFLCPEYLVTVVCPYCYLAHTLKKFFSLPFEHTICEDCFSCNYITFILSVL